MSILTINQEITTFHGTVLRMKERFSQGPIIHMAAKQKLLPSEVLGLQQRAASSWSSWVNVREQAVTTKRRVL